MTVLSPVASKTHRTARDAKIAPCPCQQPRLSTVPLVCSGSQVMKRLSRPGVEDVEVEEGGLGCEE